MMRTAAVRALSRSRPTSIGSIAVRPGCVVRPMHPIAIRTMCAKPEGKGDGQLSIIAQATALEHGGKKFGVKDDIMMQPTVAGKAYKATSYATQGLLALGGVCLFGWIVKNLYNNMMTKTSPTQMFNTAMSQMEIHPKVELELGMPIKGHGGTGGRASRQMEHYKGKRADGETYTYIKFVVEGYKHDGLVHVEYKGNELNYLIVEVPASHSSFIIEDNRRKNK